MLWTVFFDAIEFVLGIGSTIVLTRLLFPEDFGLMGLASIAIQFARRLANFGFTSVLVQLPEIKDEHYDTVYIMNLALMTSLAAFLFLAAPYYAAFFEKDALRLIIRVVAVDFVLKAFSSVPQAVLRRHMNFQLLGMSETVGKVSGIVATMTLALFGCGVWSLVFGTLFGSMCHRSMVIRCARRYSPWRPRYRFRLWALKETFAFGAWMYVNSFISFAVNKVDYFVIGKFLGVVQLGFYERAFQLMSMPRKQVVRKINTVLFSGYSRIQDDGERLVRGMLHGITYLSCVSYPVMIWLFFVAPSFITVVYGAKWTPTIAPLQIMCLSGLLDSFTLAFQPLLRARGLIAHQTRRDLTFLIILGVAVLLTVRWGITGVSWGVVTASIMNLSLMLQITKRYLPMTVGRFVQAQRSAMVYGMIQSCTILLFQMAARAWFSVDSWQMLLAISLLSPLSVIGSHAVLRFQDVDEVFHELGAELRKFTRTLPGLRKPGPPSHKPKKDVPTTP